MPLLENISKYPNAAQEMIDLHKANPKNINLLSYLLKLIYQYDINYDSLTNSLIEAFSNPKNKFVNNLDISQLNKENLLVLIFILTNSNKKFKDRIDVEINNKNDLENYETLLEHQLDMHFRETRNIDKMKNALLHKIFGVSLSEAHSLVDKYGVSLSKFDDNNSLMNIKMIKRIIDEENKDVLKDIYYNHPKLNIEEKILLEQEVKKIFNQRISDTLYKISDSKPSGHLEYGNTLIPFYLPSAEFYLLVNSLSAFEFKEKISDYNKFWNFNEKVQNHGICCSLISNQNIGQTAPIKDIIVGFDSFSDTAIQLANSNDIISKTDTLEISSCDSACFMTPEDYVNNTRSAYNELVLERKELRQNQNTNYTNIQPSYVIIYNTFNEEQITNSLKAAYELNIPIVFLKVNEIALNESKVIEQYKEYIMDTFDMNIFSKLIVRLENNIYGFSFSNPNIIKLYFDKEEFAQFMENLFSKIYASLQNEAINHSSAIKFFNQIIAILEKEIEKCAKKTIIKEALDKKQYIERAKYYINLVEKINIHKTL